MPFFRQLGIDLVSHIGGKHISLPRLSATCNYTSPVRFPDKLDIAVRVIDISRKTIRYSFEMRVDSRGGRRRNSAVYCEVGEKLKSIPIPDGDTAKARSLSRHPSQGTGHGVQTPYFIPPNTANEMFSCNRSTFRKPT